MTDLLSTVIVALFLWLILAYVRPPARLRGIPCVPVEKLLWSYLSGETEEERVKQVILPFARQKATDVVLVWCLGQWMVHIVNAQVGRQVMESRNLRKQQPPSDMLLWRLTGRQNVFLSEGEQWRKHSNIVRLALHQTAPIHQFLQLSRKTLSMIGEGGKVRWSDYTHRFTLDAVGTTVLGYDFRALDDPDSPFVREYHEVMTGISDPLYLFMPSLERWFPRRKVASKLEHLVGEFEKLLVAKREQPGDDMITYMFEEPSMTNEELRDNVIVTFMGGHDTTAGALSTVVLYLAKFEGVQDKAREEVMRVLRSDDPSVELFKKMPYLRAIIWESMRLNNPSNVTIPRITDIPVQAGHHHLPPGTPIVLNMCAILHNEAHWSDHASFRPERFLHDPKLHSENWVPFGLGPRQCPARNFSLYEQRTLVSLLLREYRWELPEDSIHTEKIKNAFSPFALSLPYDVEIIFHKIREVPESHGSREEGFLE